MREKNSLITFNQQEINHYLKDVRKIKVLTPEREKELSNLMKTGSLTEREKERIQRELVEGNLRFVITVAKQYQNQGMDFPDLVAEGNLGLIKAIKNFDWGKDLRFISYAVWWIKQSILQSLNDNSRTIRLPVNVVQGLHKAKKEMDGGGKEMDLKYQNLPSMIDLDSQINEDGDTLLDIVKNENSISPDFKFNQNETLKDKLKDVLECLNERERIIVEDYYGISGTPRTLEEIGDDFNLTKERVRQIKQKALRKLRNDSSVLFDYL